MLVILFALAALATVVVICAVIASGRKSRQWEEKDREFVDQETNHE